MSEPKPVVLSWSGGKDSTLALAALRASRDWRVAALLTTVNPDFDRISMHGVRSALLRLQADALDLPLMEVEIPSSTSNAVYGDRMRAALDRIRTDGIEAVAFGDLFLEDVRAYRERMMGEVGMTTVFPVWGIPTAELAETFIAAGHRAIVVCVDTQQIAGDFAGRDYDEALLADLPKSADLCGENGEFHTFVHDGPLFRRPVACTRGERVLREDRFMYQDLI
jgi:uncharacterized protein (TIGR00290 family)